MNQIERSLFTGRRATRGFNLVELMIASTLGVMVMTAVMTTFSATTKHFKAIANYGTIHREGRTSVDVFAQDFRKCSDITSAGSTSVTLLIPTAFNSQGTPTST